MRSFVVSLLLLACILTFILCNMFYINRKIDAFSDINDVLPRDAAEFDARYDNIGELVETLWILWDESFSRIALTTGYENINRADDALLSLRNAYLNHDGDDFALARATLADSLERLRTLERLSFDSIF